MAKHLTVNIQTTYFKLRNKWHHIYDVRKQLKQYLTQRDDKDKKLCSSCSWFIISMFLHHLLCSFRNIHAASKGLKYRIKDKKDWNEVVLWSSINKTESN